ncbi:MAG: Ig-like domain-containing protein, partial [Ilumatobacteraceae bacterium]
MGRYFRPFLRLAPAVGILTSLLALAPVELQMSAPFFRPLSATVYAAGGPVILDGTDAGYHGGVTNSAVWGQWIYVKKAYENLTAGVSSSYSSSSNGRIAVVGAPLSGSNTNNISNNCGGAAYWGATTMASPKGVDFYDGASAIETFFNDVQSGTVKPLLIHIVDGICNTNRMDGTEYTKVNAAANAIATHVNRGGALFANTGAYISGATNYGWLSTLFPTLSPNGDYGSNLQLTAAGQSAFPGLTNSNIAGAWHNGFVDSSGTYPLDVLATEGSGASLKRGILGGASVTLPSAVTITADSSSSTAGGTICFTVNVKRGNPLANFQGASVSFAVAGANAGASMATATTDASGNTPSRCYTGTNAGSDTVTATAVNPSAGNASLGEGVKNVTWTALSATATTATLGPNQNATVQGSATGTVYLVNTSVTVSNLSSITGAAGDLWNSVSISSANSNTSLALSGLSAGTYKAYLADGSGNLSPASSGTVTVDTTRPTVTITRAGSGAVGDGQTLAITFTLSSASSDFALGDIGVSGGTLSGFSGSGTTYTATWTPPANGSGVENIYVNAGGFTNSLGNTNTASSSLNIVWNANLPSVTITRAGSGTVGGGQDVTVTFTLSESSSNFVVGDITVSGGTLSGFASSNPLTYTATWTAPATGSGTASISVAANKFTNAAGNNNTASTALSIVWNTNLPSVTITRAGSGTVGGG